MLEQFVISRIVDIDLLMQIWISRVKQINFVLEWVERVRNRCLHLATGRTRDDKRKGSGNDREERGRNEGERVTKKAGVVKSRHG
ncbi:hypothetical protein TNCV_2520821 [Trichonephila clavipes]|nr:hypothetical protein TNCV_2520821 [Trichonephila clavipes]